MPIKLLTRLCQVRTEAELKSLWPYIEWACDGLLTLSEQTDLRTELDELSVQVELSPWMNLDPEGQYVQRKIKTAVSRARATAIGC
jgi:hypothetical protein